MASRRSLVAIVACVLLVAACTESGAGVVGPTTSEMFAATPSIGDLVPATTTRPAPSTTLDVERTVIYPADPLTLEALPGFEPIPMGDWTWGVSSPSGRWLALIYGDDSGVATGLRLVDPYAWEVVGEWSSLYVSPTVVTDDGVIYAISYSAQSPELVRMLAGIEEPVPITALSPNFAAWDIARLWVDQIHLAGQRNEAGATSQSALSLLSVDLSSGTTTESTLTDVPLGVTQLVDLGEGATGAIDTVPAVVWDEGNGRFLTVHATEDVITELDVTSRTSTKHRFGPLAVDTERAPITDDELNEARSWATSRRTAALSPDGTMMYIAGNIGEFVERDDQVWSVTKPSGIVKVDTGTWEIIDQLDAPISEVYISPHGRSILATGYTHEDSGSSYVSESSGLYVIDPVDLEVIAHHPPDRAEAYFGLVSYNPGRSIAYVTFYHVSEQVDVVDLDTGEVVNSRSGIQIFGESAIVVETRESSG